MNRLPYAEDVNYYKTGQSSADSWIEKAKKEIAGAGGKVLGEAFGSESGGRSAFMIQFAFKDEPFKLMWPVLPTRANTPAAERAAKIQAATMLYHDVKARCVAAKVLGFRTAFFNFLLLPTGETASQLATPELAIALPEMFGGRKQLTG